MTLTVVLHRIFTFASFKPKSGPMPMRILHCMNGFFKLSQIDMIDFWTLIMFTMVGVWKSLQTKPKADISVGKSK